MTLQLSFKGQTVLVTGGTRGIGKAVAKAVSAAGGQAIITGTGSTPPPWLEDLDHRGEIHYRQLDLAEETWTTVLDSIIADFPSIGICINNAGINIVDDIRDVRQEDLDQVLRVNLQAPATIVSRLAPRMAAKGYGRIVNIASIFGIGSRAGRSSYSASKAGLIGLTKAVALDLATDGILVNAVCPGFIATDLTRRVLGEQGMAEMALRVPLGRLAEPEEIVPSILFLASNLNTYITGQVLVVDGGYLAG